MEKIFLVYNAENSDDEDEVVAVFTDGGLATGFTERHPRFFGRYRIEERELNPYFEKTDKWVSLVSIDGDNEDPEVSSIAAFDEEQLAYANRVNKYDETFYMYLFATDKKEAASLAKAKFDAMVKSGEWVSMNDDADDDE